MSQGKTLGTSGARLADYLSASLLARVFPASGSDLLWRCAKNRQLPVHKALSDGSYLSALAATRRSPAGVSRTIKDAAQGVVVRVIEYSLPGSEERYRLITSLLDEREAPALELAALYHQRWQVEAVFDELKTTCASSAESCAAKPGFGAPGALRLGASAFRGALVNARGGQSSAVGP